MGHYNSMLSQKLNKCTVPFSKLNVSLNGGEEGVAYGQFFGFEIHAARTRRSVTVIPETETEETKREQNNEAPGTGSFSWTR